MSLRRSGISDLLGLLALLTIGLEGGRLWLPITLQLALREGIRPSRSSRSPVLVGLRLGCMTGMEGPPLLWRTAEQRHTETHIRNILHIVHSMQHIAHPYNQSQFYDRLRYFHIIQVILLPHLFTTLKSKSFS